jgi:hypothetical protein
MTAMLHFPFDLPNVWMNMLHTQILSSFNVDSNFKYTPVMKNKHVLLGCLDNAPNFIPGTELFLILGLELVLVRDTPEPTLLNDLLESLSNFVEGNSLFALNGTFSTLGDLLESN